MKGLELITRYLRIGLYLGLAAYTVFTFATYHEPSPNQPITHQPTPKAVNINGYIASRICPDAWEQAANHVNQHENEDIEYFDVTLKTGCFSGFVRYPKTWLHVGYDFVNPQPNDYVAFWFNKADAATGPYTPNALPEFTNVPSNEFRLQGAGTFRLYKIR